MPILIQLQRSSSRNLPLHFSENIDGLKFSVDFKLKKSSDIILVKCSNDAYLHGSNGYKLTINNYLAKYKNLVSSNTSKYKWVPLLKKSSNSARSSCGEITIKPGNVMSPMKEQKTRISSNNMDSPLPETYSNCHNETKDLLIVFRTKEKDTEVIVNPRDVNNPYAN
uniref:Ubiquitin-like domain-containing protein n=1 Tax=Strongyloides venezuelensis TaxID=75913 RepID=A0A0K0G325_STRVS